MKFIIENWELISSIILFVAGGGFLGWKMKKAEAEKAIHNAEQSKTEAVQSIKELYGDFVGDFKIRYDELKNDLAGVRKRNQDEIRSIKTELTSIKKENIEQRHDLRKLNDENRELRQELAKWQQMYNALKSEFDIYRANNENLNTTSSNGK